MKRWIALVLGIGIALGAAYVRLQRGVPAQKATPMESIGAASRARLDDVLRKSGAGEDKR